MGVTAATQKGKMMIIAEQLVKDCGWLLKPLRMASTAPQAEAELQVIVE